MLTDRRVSILRNGVRQVNWTLILAVFAVFGLLAFGCGRNGADARKPSSEKAISFNSISGQAVYDRIARGFDQDGDWGTVAKSVMFPLVREGAMYFFRIYLFDIDEDDNVADVSSAFRENVYKYNVYPCVVVELPLYVIGGHRDEDLSFRDVGPRPHESTETCIRVSGVFSPDELFGLSRFLSAIEKDYHVELSIGPSFQGDE